MADSIESGSSGRMGPLPTLDEDRPSRQPEMKSQGHSQKPPLSSPSQPQQAILGHLLASNSVQNVSGGHFYLDWALVHVDALNFKQSGNGTARFPSFAAINLDELAKSTDNKPDQRPATANVLVATGSNGILKGTLSSNITYMGLDPKNEVFQEVWTVHLNGPLGEFSFFCFVSNFYLTYTVQHLATAALGLSTGEMAIFTAILLQGIPELPLHTLPPPTKSSKTLGACFWGSLHFSQKTLVVGSFQKFHQAPRIIFTWK
jgi:hypothetical protein